ncbi:MAG: hypothetical protein PHF51_02655, partial [Candidatus ainarchaeum sp.]|nr:hypothetical protein [Candidatus ainarchaeum sp.]
NEVLDDLPARMVSKTAKGFSEAWLELHLPEGAEARDKRGRRIGFRELGDALSSGSAARLAGIDGALAEKLELEVAWRPAGTGLAAREAVEASLPGIPGGTVIPLPLGAVKCVEGVHRALGDGGIYDVFDYGFDSVKGLLSLQPGVFRTPGALTAFVNFPFLVDAARKIGYRKACLEPQRDFTGGNEDRRFYHLRLVK